MTQREHVERNIYETRRALSARFHAQERHSDPNWPLPAPHSPERDREKSPAKHPKAAVKYIRTALRRGRCDQARDALRELQTAVYGAQWHDRPKSEIRRALIGIEKKVGKACRRK